MLFNRQRRIYGDYLGPSIAWTPDPHLRKEIVKKIKEEEQVLSNLEVDRKLIKELESILFLISFPFFCIWAIILMPVIVILWIAAKFDRERHTL
jgi:hypothetical protein